MLVRLSYVNLPSELEFASLYQQVHVSQAEALALFLTALVPMHRLLHLYSISKTSSYCTTSIVLFALPTALWSLCLISFGWWLWYMAPVINMRVVSIAPASKRPLIK